MTYLDETIPWAQSGWLNVLTLSFPVIITIKLNRMEIWIFSYAVHILIILILYCNSNANVSEVSLSSTDILIDLQL